jgi:hypothetical protein
MVTVALFVRIEAKPGQEAAVEKFLKDGLQIVEGEPATIAWFGLRLGPYGFADHQLRGARAVLSAVSMWFIPRSRPRHRAAIADARSSRSMDQVPWPITLTSRCRGPKRRLLTLVRVPWVALRSMTPPACAAE